MSICDNLWTKKLRVHPSEYTYNNQLNALTLRDLRRGIGCAVTSAFTYRYSPYLCYRVLHNGSSCQLPDGKPMARIASKLEMVLILRLAQEWEHICAQPIITDVAYIMGNSLRVLDFQPSMSKQLNHIIRLHKRLVEQ